MYVWDRACLNKMVKLYVHNYNCEKTENTDVSVC